VDTITPASLYPPIRPYADGFLDVGDGHSLYWEESGSPSGIPVVYVHGGPGAGCIPTHRRLFDQDRYRIIIFDQRGCGRSRPTASIENNTTRHLIADMETLRQHRNIPQWLLVGGSWGSTLSLAYGQAYPERCSGFVLRGIFLFEDHEIDWFVNGMGKFFPEAHRRWLKYLPPANRNGPLTAYHTLLNDPDPNIHGPAAHIWNAYEASCSSLYPPCSDEVMWRIPETVSRDVLALARLENHYLRNNGFLEPAQLMTNIQRLKDIPMVIVQGRYDMVCPIITADRLARVLPLAEFHIIPDAGHSVFEPGIRSALMTSLHRFAHVRARSSESHPEWR
jgi:proline iminopeptidase